MYTRLVYTTADYGIILLLSKHAFTITILPNVIVQKASASAGSFPRPPIGALPLDSTRDFRSPEPPDWPVFILGLTKGNSTPQKNWEIPPKFDETKEPEARIHGWMTLTKFWYRFAFTV